MNLLTKQMCLILIAVATLVGIASDELSAQSSELQGVDWVPEGTAMFAFINMESLFDQVEPDHPVIEAFRKRDAFSPLDFTEVKSYVVLLSGDRPDGMKEYSTPAVIFSQFNNEINQQELIALKEREGIGQTFEVDEYNGYSYYGGEFSDEDADYFIENFNTKCLFFPSENTYVEFDRPMLEPFLDGDDDSAGRDLVSNLDSEADVHVLVDGGSVLDQGFFAEAFGEILPGINAQDVIHGLDRFELLIDVDQMVPARATIEMNSEEIAKEVEEFFRNGVAALPALLMMAEGELDAAVERESEGESFGPSTSGMVDQLKELIELARVGIREIEVVRNGMTVELELGSFDGLEKMPGLILPLFAQQQMEIENFLSEDMVPGDVKGGIID